MGEVLGALWSRVTHLLPPVGETAMLALLLGFVAAAVYWMLLIFE
jgi:hypothetical protein